MLVTEYFLYTDESHRYVTWTYLPDYPFTLILTDSLKHGQNLKGLCCLLRNTVSYSIG